MRIDVTPTVLQWASERAARDGVDVAFRCPQLSAWQAGTLRPTLIQLESFARTTHTPIGSFFLPTPPVETLPIADFRAGAAFEAGLPSGNLLDTLYACQRRQDWYLEHAQVERLDPVPWVGAFTLTDSPGRVAAELRRALRFERADRDDFSDWRVAHRELVTRVESQGVLVSTNGVVGNATRRRLDPSEFRGFSLADATAPLVFVNGADLKASHSFTLCHELAHLALGKTGISAEDPAVFQEEAIEVWCDEVATEILVPRQELSRERRSSDAVERATRISRDLKVTPMVALRRVVEQEKLGPAETLRSFSRLRDQLTPAKKKQGGGNFHATALVRVGRRFARALIESTLEGRTTYVEAFRLLGIGNGKSFDELSDRVGLPA